MTASFNQRYGRWAIVTGASSGIGEAFAYALAARGVPSILVARNQDSLNRVASNVFENHGLECRTLALDLADPNFLSSLLDGIRDYDIGLVVGNAAYNPVGSFTDMSYDMVMRMLDVNAKANVALANAFIPAFKERGRGGFLLVGSTESFNGIPYSAVYSATKAFVLSFGEALWGELLGSGVDVSVVLPGATDTPLLASRDLGRIKITPMMPGTVAELSLNYLGRGPYIIPGFGNRWGQRLMRRLPRAFLVKTVAPIMKQIVDNSK